MSQSSLFLRRTASVFLAWAIGLAGPWFWEAGKTWGQDLPEPAAPADLPDVMPADPAVPPEAPTQPEAAPVVEAPPAEQRPYDVLPIDPQEEGTRVKARGEINRILREQRFGPGDQEFLESHFRGYILARWTHPQNATLLPGFRVELQRQLWFAKGGPPHTRLNELILETFGAVVNGHFHPAAQVNAALMIGELNSVEPAPSGPPPETLP